MSTEVVVALIGGGSGLVTGTVGSLVAPWSVWRAEKQKLRHARMAELMSEWREGVNQLRADEDEACPRMPIPRPPGESGDIYGVLVSQMPDPDNVKVDRLDWFLSMETFLSEEVLSEVQSLGSKRLHERSGRLPDILAREIARIEHKRLT